VILLGAEEFAHALTGEADEVVVVEPGVERQISVAVLCDALIEPLKDLPHTLHDLVHVKDVGAKWHDSMAMMWSPATLVHGAKLSRGEKKELLAALSDDIVWNGEPIEGMTEQEAAALADVHAQRV
jgi:hypothetical protein